MRLAVSTLYGPLLWAGQFLLVYASESLFCRAGAGETHRAFALAVSVAAAGVLVVLVARQWRALSQPALDSVGVPLAGLSLLAIVWTALPSLLMASCTAAT